MPFPYNYSTVDLWRIVLHGMAERLCNTCFQFWQATCPVRACTFGLKFSCAVATVIQLLCGDFSFVYVYS